LCSTPLRCCLLWYMYIRWFLNCRVCPWNPTSQPFKWAAEQYFPLLLDLLCFTLVGYITFDSLYEVPGNSHHSNESFLAAGSLTSLKNRHPHHISGLVEIKRTSTIKSLPHNERINDLIWKKKMLSLQMQWFLKTQGLAIKINSGISLKPSGHLQLSSDKFQPAGSSFKFFRSLHKARPRMKLSGTFHSKKSMGIKRVTL